MNTLLLIGGDQRQRYLKKALLQNRFEVLDYGIEIENDNIYDLLWKADAIILPLPATIDSVHISFPLQPELSLRFSTLLERVRPHTRIFGGKLPISWQKVAEEKEIPLISYDTSEFFLQQNALATAEGAIRLLLESVNRILQGSEVGVVGYGRIGRLLCEKLTALGCKVTLFARKEKDRCEAEVRGLKSLPIENGTLNLLDFSPDCNVVFNTAPQRLLPNEKIVELPKEFLWIELASLPGGVDPVAIQSSGRSYLLGSGLPGKFFPKTAGEIIAESLLPLFSYTE